MKGMFTAQTSLLQMLSKAGALLLKNLRIKKETVWAT